VMPYTAQFFAEKLNVPVEYFNPLRNVQLDETINLEELARVAHSLGEVVGLGLRNLAHCPVELNLMPESTLRWQSFNQKKPYFIATVFSLVAVIAAMGLLFQKLAAVKSEVLETVQGDVAPEEQKEVRFKREYAKLNKTQADVDQMVAWLRDRYYWAEVLSELRQVLIRVEQATADRLRTDASVWIEQLLTVAPRPEDAANLDLGFGGPSAGPVPSAAQAAAQDDFMRRYGLTRDGAPAEPPPASLPPEQPIAPDGTMPPPESPGDTNEIGTLTLTFRAVSLKTISNQPDADKGIAYTVLHELQNDPLFDPDPQKTRTEGDVINDEETGTFTFTIIARLKRPLKL